MPDLPSGPLPSRASDYAHARHAGNAGDVFKHVALAATLGAFREPPALYAESHAGDGLFSLGSVGEWTGGVARLWSPGGVAAGQTATGNTKSVNLVNPATPANPAAPASAGATERWLAVVRGFSPAGASRPEKLPGSPLLARALLPASARMVLHELDPQAAEVLRRTLAAQDAKAADHERHATWGLHEQDGFPGIAAALASAGGAPACALLDPPYTQKAEWSQAAEALAACAKAAPQASLLLWYPIKALTRPRALLAELVRAGVHGTLVELITTPLRLKRDKLSGSGMLFVHPPPGAVEALLAELPRLGAALMTHGEWSAQQIGF